MIAASDMFGGGDPLGGPPPAISAKLSDRACMGAARTDEAAERTNEAIAIRRMMMVVWLKMRMAF